MKLFHRSDKSPREFVPEAAAGVLLLLLSGAGALAAGFATSYLPYGLLGAVYLLQGLFLAPFLPPPVRKGRGKWLRPLLAFVCEAGTTVLFFLLLRRKTGIYRLTWAGPALLALLFVLFVIAEKVCAHRTDGSPRRDALLRTVRSHAAAARLCAVPVFVGSACRLLELFDPLTVLLWVLAVLYGYIGLFLAILCAVRLLRRETETRPDLSVPVPFSGRRDYGVLSFLEESTGITMRSLWSLKFIRSLLPYAALLMLTAFWASTCFHEIRPFEEGALLRCGSLSDRVLEPGLHLTLPWPLDRVEKYETQTVRKMTVGYESETDSDNIWTSAHGSREFKLLLGNGNELVSVNLRIEYRISDLLAYLTASSSPENMLRGRAYELITSTVIRTDLNTLLTADRTAFARTFEEELRQNIEEIGGDGRGIGLEIVSVVLESIHPPVEVAEKYQALIGAEIDADRARLQAQSYAAITVAAAEARRDTAVCTAEAERNRKISAARGSVTEFMAGAAADREYPEAYRYEKYLNAVCRAYGNSSLILVGGDIDPSRIWLGSLPLSAR